MNGEENLFEKNKTEWAEKPIDLGWLHKPVPLLPVPSGKVVTVNSVDQLLTAVKEAEPNSTILVSKGIYHLPETVILEKDGLTLIGEDRDGTVLRGNGFHGDAPGPRDVITIQKGKKITIANLSVKESDYYGISILGQTGPHGVHIYNVKFVNIGRRCIKGNAASHGVLNADYCLVEHCHFEQTKAIPLTRDDGFEGNYIGGMDLHGVKGWIIRDNVFLNIRGATGGGRGAIFVWNNSMDTIVERNLIIGCDRGICIGNPHGPNEFARAGEEVYHHTGGIVRNNFVYSLENKMGVELVKTRGLLFANNTVYNVDPDFSRAVEYSFPVTAVKIINNLVRGQITSNEGGRAELSHNLTQAPQEWFVDPANGDLRLKKEALQAVSSGMDLADVQDDFFRNERKETYNIGAHQA